MGLDESFTPDITGFNNSHLDQQQRHDTSPPHIVSLDQLESLHGELDLATRDGGHAIMVGGGPCTTMGEKALVDLMSCPENRERFRQIQQLGGTYCIRSTIIERGEASKRLGQGNGWGPDQGCGTVNSGVEDGALRYHERTIADLTERHAELAEKYRKENPVAAVLLQSVFRVPSAKSGTPLTDRSVGERRDRGQEEMETFMRSVREACQAFPFYRVTVVQEAEVSHIDLSDAARPALTLRRASDTHNSCAFTLPANMVRLNTGTTLSSPIKDEAVLEHAFVQPMDPHALRSYLANKKLLGEDGMLACTDKAGTRKCEVRLALGGTGLSLFDELIALLSVMDLVVLDDASPIGYRIRETAREQYRDVLTVISFTPGKIIPPRHAHAPVWTQRHDGYGTAEEQHAAFLHEDGKAVFDGAWYTVVRASVAATLGLLPGELDRNDLSTEELAAHQYDSSVWHESRLKRAQALAEAAARARSEDPDWTQQKDAQHQAALQALLDEATWTLPGAMRQAHLLTVLGGGMTRNLEETARTMAEKAPWTYKGRGGGYLMHRAQLASVTRPGSATATDNRRYLRNFSNAMAWITSSPYQVQALLHMLIDAGIARYLPGGYDNFRAVQGGKALSFTSTDGRHTQFDAFIVSPTFNRRAEPALQSLAGQIAPMHPAIPDLGQVTRNRLLVTKHGETSHVEDNSMNGKGETLPGTTSKIGAFAIDINNRESKVDLSMAYAHRRLACAHLAAVGVENPVEVVERLYERHLPTKDQFDLEAACFEPHFNALQKKSLYLESLEKVVAGRFNTAVEELFETHRRKRDGDICGTRSLLNVDTLPEKIRYLERAGDAAMHCIREQCRALYQKASRTALDLDAGLRMARWVEKQGLRDPVNQDELNTFVETIRRYEEGLPHLPRYCPTSRDDYLKRFVDVPLHLHEAVLEEAFGIALTIARQGNDDSRTSLLQRSWRPAPRPVAGISAGVSPARPARPYASRSGSSPGTSDVPS